MKTRLKIKGIEKLTYSKYRTKDIRIYKVKEAADNYSILLHYKGHHMTLLVYKLAENISSDLYELKIRTRCDSAWAGGARHTTVESRSITTLSKPSHFVHMLENHILTNKSKLGLT
jgi:hypothetical protein